MKKGVSERVGHRWWTPNVKGSVGGACFTHCHRCGLMPLKNDATYRAIKAGCFKDEVVMDVTDDNGNFR